MKFKDGGSATVEMKDVNDIGIKSKMRVVLAIEPDEFGCVEIYCTAANARALAAKLTAAADRLDKATRKPAR